MKKIILVLAIIAAVCPARAQEKAKWNEMEAFHDLIAKTFHPAEEGKLEPIRTHSAELLQMAIAWEKAGAPAGYDKNAVKKSLKSLVKGAKEVNELVQKKASDSELKKKLSELHDIFHQIMDKCEKEGGH